MMGKKEFTPSCLPTHVDREENKKQRF